MSLSVLDTFAFWLTITAITLPVLGGVAALLALLSSSQASTIRDGDLARFKADSMTKISSADERAAAAYRDASAANERATVVEHANLEMRGQVAGLERDAADAQTRQVRAERELLEFSTRLKPRGIDSKTFASVIRTTPRSKIVVEYQPGNPEAYGFAHNLAGQLRDAWRISPTLREIAPETFSRGSVLAEIVFAAHSLEQYDVAIRAISDALILNGLTSLGSMRDESLPEDTLYIRVGPKLLAPVSP